MSNSNNNRFKVHKFSASVYIVADSTTGNEICALSDYETSDGDWTDDALYRAMTIAACLNKAAWDYRPSFSQ
jgi:hypothetical protein